MKVVDLINELSCFKGKVKVSLVGDGLRVGGKNIVVPKAAEPKAPEA